MFPQNILRVDIVIKLCKGVQECELKSKYL